MAKVTLAVIVGNRDFFPDRLISEGRKDILAVCEELNINTIILDENATKMGSVETWAHAKECAALFKKHADNIDGILVTLPNFGDEKGVADTVKLSGLNVPILVQAYPDAIDQFNVERRRDAFCGKVSVCNNLRQYRFPFTLTGLHTVHPNTEEFKHDLKQFKGVCRVVKGLKNARLGAIGARPNAFNTVRYSEKLLQESGISVQTCDLSEIFGLAQKMNDGDAKVQEKLSEINAYADAGSVPQASMVSMARLGVAIDDWMQEYDLNATAIQCWTSIQSNYGINSCALMSMMSERLMPSACEVDITGAVSMYALQLASRKPSALVDWNNNYGEDPDKCVFFHCGNWAKSFLPDIQIKTAEILGTIIGEEKTYGAVSGRTPEGPMTFARISTDDINGMIRTCVGEGNFTDDLLTTFGAKAVVEIPDLQYLMKFICMNGFEHHTAMSASHTSGILEEAFGRYMDWDVYNHGSCSCNCK